MPSSEVGDYISPLCEAIGFQVTCSSQWTVSRMTGSPPYGSFEKQLALRAWFSLALREAPCGLGRGRCVSLGPGAKISLYSFPAAAVPKCHRLRTTEFLFSQSGGQKSELRVSQGCAPSEGSREAPFLAPSSPWCCLTLDSASVTSSRAGAAGDGHSAQAKTESRGGLHITTQPC